ALPCTGMVFSRALPVGPGYLAGVSRVVADQAPGHRCDRAAHGTDTAVTRADLHGPRVGRLRDGTGAFRQERPRLEGDVAGRVVSLRTTARIRRRWIRGRPAKTRRGPATTGHGLHIGPVRVVAAGIDAVDVTPHVPFPDDGGVRRAIRHGIEQTLGSRGHDQ